MNLNIIRQAFEYGRVRGSLLDNGYAVIRSAIDDTSCRSLIAEFESSEKYRKHIIMDNHGFGSGEYKYFRYPLPKIINGIRETLYDGLYGIGNEWNELLSVDSRYPKSLSEFLSVCKENGQERPTPLILRYLSGGYNRMHQDLYGDISFPFQVVILLSNPGEDFLGGEFLLSEQRPRQQARINVLNLGLGDAVIIPSSTKPQKLKTKVGRSVVKHGIGTVSSGERFTLGVVFHDSK